MRAQRFLNITSLKQEKRMKTKAKIFITRGLLSLTLIFLCPSRGYRYHYFGAPDNPLETFSSAICKVKGP
jgi:hypothetical protein